jgi:hypothetical protein
MIDFEKYMLKDADFAREIAAFEAEMDSLMMDIAIESTSQNSNEPDGSRIRNAYKDLGSAIKSKDDRKIKSAQKEIADASTEVDRKVKDPEKKKKIIKIAVLAAMGAAAIAGSIGIMNRLKNHSAKTASEVAAIAKDLPKIKSSGKVDTEIVNAVTDTKKNPPWGKGSFDEFMKSSDNRLVFK